MSDADMDMGGEMRFELSRCVTMAMLLSMLGGGSAGVAMGLMRSQCHHDPVGQTRNAGGDAKRVVIDARSRVITRG